MITFTKQLHPNFIEEVGRRIDIVDVISQYVELKKRGKEYLGLCPFHGENTPSFSVSPSKGLAYCFGCTWGGNAIKFVMELGKVSFTDAVLDLARSVGVPIQYKDGSSEDFPEPLPRPAITKPTAAKEDKPQKDYTVSAGRVEESVFRLLHYKGDAEKARAWLQNRGITREMIERYRLGLEKRVVVPDESKPDRKQTYWAIAIFIPVPNRPGRFYVKKRVAPWLGGDERPNYLGKWTQFGVPATVFFTYNPPDAQQTWFCEGEWDAIALGELARSRGEKVAIACSTAGCGTVPKDDELARLPGQVVILFDRNDAPNKNGLRPGDEGAKKLALALGDRGSIALVPMPYNCSVKGWDVCNALDTGYTWEDFEAAASSAFSYTTSRQELDKNSDRPISRDQWELTFGFGKRLRERVKLALESFKGFGKPPAPKPKPDVAPAHLFKDVNERQQVLQDAVKQGYKYILDASAPGLGKSHAAGIALPEAFGVEKLWYLANDHRNPTTGVIELNYVDLPVRNDGLKIDDSRKTPNGNPFLVWPKPGEEPDTKGNCPKTDLFQKFRAKNLNVEAAVDSPICQSCKLAYLCKNGSGQKYGASFRGERRNVLAANRIRAHADSMPSPDDFDYTASGLLWDEVGTQLKPMESVTVSLVDFDQVWGEMESIAPNLHDQLKPLRLALRPLLTGETKQPFHGWDDSGVRALLPEKPSNLDAIITELGEALKPDLDFLEETPDSISDEEELSKAQQRIVNREFRRQAHEKFNNAFEQLALNWLVPFLKVWNGERGAFRCEWQNLIIFTKSDRHTSVARSAKFNIFLDATIDRFRLALLLGIDPEEIYVVGQETPNHGNLKILQVTGLGKLGKDRSDSLKDRVAALKKTLEERYPGIVFGDWKAHTEASDGRWFVNLRGSNEFQAAPALAVFGIPYQNVGHLQALYQTLTGEFAPLDRENPHSGLQRFIEAHVRAEIEQAVGRLRSHLRPNEQLTFMFVGDYDLNFLGLPVEQVEAFQITPEAGTATQLNGWKIFQAIQHLRAANTKVIQKAVEAVTQIGQSTISEFAAKFGGWKRLLKISEVLLEPFNSTSDIFLTDEERAVLEEYFPLVLDSPPEELTTEVEFLIRSYGFDRFLMMLKKAPLDQQVKMLVRIMDAFQDEKKEVWQT